jgi:hypothetical protein
MKTFTAQYSRTDYGTIWFEAETKEQAEELLHKVYNLDLEMEELPKYQGKGKDVFDLDHLEEVN